MKSTIIAFAIFGCAVAAVVPDQTASVLRSSNEQTPDGGFSYRYETENGISSQAEGQVKVVGKDEAILTIAGNNQFTSPEGQVFQITYTADENGYHPQGAHLPTPPAPEPLPEHVAKALEWIAAHPYVEKKN